jgi:hypothetical protein
MNEEANIERDLIDYAGKCDTNRRRNSKQGYKKERKGGKNKINVLRWREAARPT